MPSIFEDFTRWQQAGIRYAWRDDGSAGQSRDLLPCADCDLRTSTAHFAYFIY